MMKTNILSKRVASLIFCTSIAVGQLVNCTDSPPPSSGEAQGHVLASLNSVAPGKEFRHTLHRSRFRIGQIIQAAQDSTIERTVGEGGVFAINLLNGAALATPSARSNGAKRDAVEEVPRFRALSTDPSVHTARVLSYFKAAGLPMEEVGGTHVTTEMAGRASKVQRVIRPENTYFVAYTTHLERVLAGVPVVNSQAWATFDVDDNVESEGVYWPAIPMDVVEQSIRLRDIVADPSRLNALRTDISKNIHDLGDTPGRVVIAHTSPTFGGTPAFVAAYEVVSHSSPAIIRHFDEKGSLLQLPDGQ